MGRRGSRGRTAALDTIEISGPFNGKAPEDTPSRRRIFICRPTGSQDEEPCAQEDHRHAGPARVPAAGRRTPTSQPLLNIYREGRSDARLRCRHRARARGAAVVAEVPASGRAGAGRRFAAGAVYRLSDLELASRLSFFLWRSIPDDELLDVAARGQAEGCRCARAAGAAHAGRSAGHAVDERFRRGNGCTCATCSRSQPDPLLFPEFDDTLREAMVRETELFFESQVREDRPILDLLRADYTFLNERLARHYGIPNVYGSHFRRVTLTDESAARAARAGAAC